MKLVWCVNCRDEFAPTEVTNTETPLCSDDCADDFWSREQNWSDYVYG